MDILTLVFVLSLLGFFFTHCLYFFNLNWQSRKTIYFVNILTLWFYFAYIGYYLLSFRVSLFASQEQHLLILGGVLLLIFGITDFFSGTKSLGFIFSALILLLGTIGLVNIHYKEIIYALGNNLEEGAIRFRNLLLFLEQLSVSFFFLAVILSILYHYSFIEVKYHHRFFFSNRFPGFDRLWHAIDYYLLAGSILMAGSLFLSLEFRSGQGFEDLHVKGVSAITVIYYLTLMYIRYRRWFSSRLNLYWMLLSLLLLLIKVGYWL